MSWMKSFLKRKTPLSDPSEESNDLELREETAEFDEFVARTELEKGENLEHGANHLANLLHFDPDNQEWLALFDQYVDKTQGELEALIPRGERLYAATEAMRALIWHCNGRLQDAVELMLQVTSATHPNYLHDWVLAWVEPEGAIESLPVKAAQYLVATALTNMPETHFATMSQLRKAQRWAAVSQRVPLQEGEDSRWLMMRAGLMRKAGLFDKALGLVKPALDAAPDWNTAVAVGLILRQKGEIAAAAEAFEAATRLDADDVSAFLEAGDMYFETDKWQDACNWYRRALAKDPSQKWAKPSALFCEWKLTGEQERFDAVAEMARSNNQRADGLLRIYYDRPFEPEDASANVLRQILEEMAGSATDEGGTVNISTSSIEAPSNALAFALAFTAKGLNIGVNYEVGSIPEPDPRQPLDAVRYKLWTYQGTVAKPGLPPPSERVRQAIAELTLDSFNRQRSFARASRVAEQLGPEALPEILAVMVHPPALPPWLNALEFIPRIQLEAMHVAAQVDEGWQESMRREALMSVLFGPMDWTINAAIDVLAFLAERHPAIAYDVHKSFQYLQQSRPNGGYCCWWTHLHYRWQSLPLLSDREREALRAKLREEEPTIH